MSRTVETAPLVSWGPYITEQVDLTRRTTTTARDPKTGLMVPIKNGVHKLYVGQSDSGKTTLQRIQSRMNRVTLVFGTKPGRDTSLEKYVTEEAFTRIESWPPKKSDLAPRGARGQVKLLLWPKITEYRQLRGLASMYRQALQSVMIEGGNWHLVIDEGLWFTSKNGLNLGQEISEIAYGGRSNGLSLSIGLQRPSGVPVITYSQCSMMYVFKLGNENDLRSIASYSQYPTRDVIDTVRGLNRGNPTKGHQFLFMPTSGGAEWKVSEVPGSWAA